MTENSGISISVIIPTWNRRALVEGAVKSLSSQTLAPDRYEIIVVDNCSTDGTRELIETLIPRSPCRLVYHRMPSNQGPVRSRNAGARLAGSSLLAFTDSDCWASPDWLATVLDVAASYPEVVMFSGMVRNKPGQPVKFFSVGAVSGETENPIYPTCNVIYRKPVFWDVGGFDERVGLFDLGGAPLECSDADLAWRVKEAGFATRFVPELLVYHEVRQAAPFDWLAAHLRVMFIPELIRRHAGLRRFLLWWGPFCLADNLLFYLACAGLVASLLSDRWWVLLSLPFLVRMARVTAPVTSWRGLSKLPAQMAFLILRQACICGALLYGSFRARRLVL